MRRFALLAALAVISIGCWGNAAQQNAVVSPERGLRNLAGSDPEHAQISVAAAMSLPLTSGMTNQFGGVMVDGRVAGPATDSVLRATGFSPIGPNGSRQSFAVCKLDGAGSAPRGSNCSSSAASMKLPAPVWSFVAVRSTPDSAYVAARKATLGKTEDSCITLSRADGRWKVATTNPISDAEHCGR